MAQNVGESGSFINLDLDAGGNLDPSPVNINAGDISGGSTSGSIAASNQRIEEFVSEGGRPLPIVYGRCFAAGVLILHKFVEGTPNSLIAYVALGDGQGNMGGDGEWDGAEAVYYAGAPLSVSPDGSTEGYRFYNGFISTAVGSGPQIVDPFLSGGLAYSGTAYTAFKAEDDVANAENRPDKLRGIFRGRRTKNFDSTGREIGYGYSTNPARAAADRILSYYRHKFPFDPALAFRLFQEKVDWEAWKIWHDFNAELIEWDDGTDVRDIPRFECHIIFAGDVTLAEALSQICASCGAFWLDDGKQIVFLPPTLRDPVHHFQPQKVSSNGTVVLGNILSKGVNVEPRDLRQAHNYFIGEVRDQDEEFLGLTSVEVRREALFKLAGENKVTHALPSMNQSQAQRLMELRARLEVDNPNIASFVADATAFRVLPGDFITVSHPTANWEYQRCLVLQVTLSSAEAAPDTCELVVQQIDGEFYSDTAHGPRQGALTP